MHTAYLAVTSLRYLYMSYFEGSLPSKSLSHFMCFVKIWTKTHSRPTVDGLNLCATSHNICLHSTKEIADNWTLGSVRLAALQTKFGEQCCPPRFYMTVTHGSVALSNGRNHRRLPFLQYSIHIHYSIKPKYIGVHLRSSCISLPGGSRATVVVTSVGVAGL